MTQTTRAAPAEYSRNIAFRPESVTPFLDYNRASMQTLGLSDSTPRTESRWRALLWPTIRNEVDLDYVTRQGFWICTFVAVVTFVLGAFAGSPGGAAFDATFFFLAGLGIRERSRMAGVSAFLVYLLGTLALQRNPMGAFGIARFIFLALLFANIRGTWLAAKWEQDPAAPPPSLRLSQTLGDKLSDRFPTLLWPKVRYVFYLLACLEILGITFILLAPNP